MPGMAETTAPDGSNGGSEAARIRAVYHERDRARPRATAIAEAYRRLNVERLARMRRVVERLFPGQQARLLDVGCGGGFDLSKWLEGGWPPECLAGTDLVPERLEAAAAAAPGVTLRLTDGVRLPFEDSSFDVATAVTVFSSILDPAMREALFREMERVVRPGGAILVYDFVVRKPTNPHVLGMTMRRLEELGRRPDASWRLSPLLQIVALASVAGSRAADLAMRVAPPTHRLSYWRVGSGGGTRAREAEVAATSSR